jgi:hypothetical protein
MKWNHIMTCQPEDGRQIVQCDPPFDDFITKFHYPIGMRQYVQRCTFESVLKFCSDNEIPNPDFWWVYAEDFPFPDKKMTKELPDCLDWCDPTSAVKNEVKEI